MYFNNYYTKNPTFKDFKKKILHHAIFVDIVEDYSKITNLSLTERESLVSNYQQELIDLENSKSTINPKFNSKQSDKVTLPSTVLPFLHFKLLRLLEDHESKTYKAVFELLDGKKIESVLMRFSDGRNSVCVSSQVGCPVGCIFCASGQMGFMRNLTDQEIIDQVLFWARWLKKIPADNNTKEFYKIAESNNFERVTNVVYMGMGEPMLNYNHVVSSLKILTDPNQFGLGDRHITVSSSGYIPQLNKFITEGLKVRLAISLHASNQEQREKLMPVAKIYSMDKLFDFLKHYEDETNKRVTYEYTLINGVNDSEDDANNLVKLLTNRQCHVNLIPLNPINEMPDLTKPSRNRIFKFFDILQKGNIPSTIRITMGDRIQAACGQLANKN